jgi:hypothetical protein
MLQKTDQTATEQAKQISKSKLAKLVKMKAGTKKQVGEINGTFGDQVKDAVAKENLRPWAFRTVCALDAMSPEKLYYEYHALMSYMENLSIEDKANKAPPLPVSDEAEAAEEA